MLSTAGMFAVAGQPIWPRAVTVGLTVEFVFIAAYAVGFVASAALLVLFGVITAGMPGSEIIG